MYSLQRTFVHSASNVCHFYFPFVPSRTKSKTKKNEEKSIWKYLHTFLAFTTCLLIVIDTCKRQWKPNEEWNIFNNNNKNKKWSKAQQSKTKRNMFSESIQSTPFQWECITQIDMSSIMGMMMITTMRTTVAGRQKKKKTQRDHQMDELCKHNQCNFHLSQSSVIAIREWKKKMDGIPTSFGLVRPFLNNFDLEA